ncbi:MAG: YkgJ family cysteine cluster protein [Proteobacteria bacterium]|nr:YkgJ family cysteine cluster protein [Pseudomonadota bacterium]
MSTPPPLDCRPACGACCIAPSISTPIPQPGGAAPRPKAAGEACPQLDAQRRCRLFGRPERPAVCRSLRPQAEMCGSSPAQAMAWLARLEAATAATRYADG